MSQPQKQAYTKAVQGTGVAAQAAAQKVAAPTGPTAQPSPDGLKAAQVAKEAQVALAQKALKEVEAQTSISESFNEDGSLKGAPKVAKPDLPLSSKSKEPQARLYNQGKRIIYLLGETGEVKSLTGRSHILTVDLVEKYVKSNPQDLIKEENRYREGETSQASLLKDKKNQARIAELEDRLAKMSKDEQDRIEASKSEDEG